LRRQDRGARPPRRRVGAAHVRGWHRNAAGRSRRPARRWRRFFPAMQGPVPRHQPISLFGIDIILAVAPLIRDLKNIAELFGGDGRNNCPALFDQGVCGQCGAVDEPTDLTHFSADQCHRPHRTCHCTICPIILGRQSFGRRDDGVMVVNQHCISECPTNIARDAKRRLFFIGYF
jgi:hypothetical protein